MQCRHASLVLVIDIDRFVFCELQIDHFGNLLEVTFFRVIDKLIA